LPDLGIIPVSFLFTQNSEKMNYYTITFGPFCHTVTNLNLRFLVMHLVLVFFICMINASELINVLTTEICKHAVTCFWGCYPGILHLLFTLSTIMCFLLVMLKMRCRQLIVFIISLDPVKTWHATT
jgi:hypothetical protein